MDIVEFLFGEEHDELGPAAGGLGEELPDSARVGVPLVDAALAVRQLHPFVVAEARERRDEVPQIWSFYFRRPN